MAPLTLTSCAVVAASLAGAVAQPGGGGQQGQWTMPAGGYDNSRFTPLNQVTRDNVKNLKVAWTFDTGVNRGQEAAPLVVGDTMYVVTPFPNILYALDLSAGGALKWKYEPKPEPAAQGVACCDVVCRGCCYWEGGIYYNTLDGHVVGVDAKSGKEMWNTKLGEINIGETMTMAPLVVKGKVLSGNSGGEFGVRGWLAATDAKSGKLVWKAYATGPDAECLIGPDFKPYYDSEKGTDLGVSSWPPNQWKIGGANAWGFVSYDPESDLIFYGTGNPGAWNPNLRPGDNKWSCGVFARRPDDGRAVWFYQCTPHDWFDWDGINECIVAEVPVNGQAHKVVIHPDRNGYLYLLDRYTGQVLSATSYSRNTASSGVDLKTGRLQFNEEKRPQMGKVVRDVQPPAPGAKDWQPSAFNPTTSTLFIPHQNLSMDWEGLEANYIAGTPYVGVDSKFYAGPGGYRGVFAAWDLAKLEKVWEVHENFPVWSGVLAADSVVFYGTMEGWFKAVDPKDGRLLWQFKTGSGIIGQPTTYTGPDGKQYVAILSGVGGWAGAIVAGGLDARDPSGASGFVNAVKDLPQVTTKGGTLYVFSLP